MRLGLGLGVSAAKKLKYFTPKNVSGLQFWLDGMQTASIQHTSNAVAQWSDRSGKGRHISQSTTGLKPTYNPTQKCVSFDGSNDCLFNAAPFMLSNGKATIYFVAKVPAQSDKRLMGEGSTSAGTVFFSPAQTGGALGTTTSEMTQLLINDSSGGVAGAYSLGCTGYDNTKRIFRLEDNGALFTGYVNGTMGASPFPYTRAGSTFTPNRFSIGAVFASTPYGHGALDLYEMIITLDDKRGEEIEAYLAYKHGLVSSLPIGHPYKTKRPKSLSEANKGIRFTAAPMKSAVMGDSITFANSNDTSSVKAFDTRGYLTNYNALSMQRLPTYPANNLGISGNTTAQMLARKTDLAPLDFDVCFLMGGINDLAIDGATPPSTIINNLNSIVNYVTQILGKRVVMLSVLPSTMSPTQVKNTIQIVNAWIMQQHGTRKGKVISVDVFTNFTSGGIPLTNATMDSLHPGPYGGMLNGVAILAGLTPYFGLGSYNFSTNNLLTNGTMAGTSGTAGTNVTGSVATGFTASGSGGTNGRTASKNGDGSQRLSISLTGATTADSLRLSQSATTGFSMGDTVYAQALVTISGTPVKIYRNGLDLRLTGTGVPTLATVTGFEKFNAAYELAEKFMTVVPGTYLIQTPDLSISSGSGMTLEWRYEMLGYSNGGSCAGTVDIVGAGVFKR